jgi:HEAT repeat protein
MNHDEVRVQREVIKALTKIGGKNVTIFFLRMLEDAPQQLAFILINSLGALGDAMAVEPLVKTASTRDIFYRNFEIRREAINSLARLGSRDSVDALGKILLKSEFLGGIRNEELRITAAKALGRLGGEKATGYLFKAAGKRNKNIKRASTAALKALGVEL